MRFFTKEWMNGDLSDAEFERVVRAYEKHLAQLSLSAGGHRLVQTTLHDAIVRVVKTIEDGLEIGLTTGDLQTGYWLTTIRYAGSESKRACSHLVDASRGEEIITDEVDQSSGAFVHRLLFANGQEVNIPFRDVSVAQASTTARDTGMAFRYLLILTVAWFVALLWCSSDGGMSIPDVLFLGYAWLPLVIAWIVGFVLTRRRRETTRRLASIATLVLLLVGAVLYWTDAAIYLRLLASRPALEDYVAAAQRGHVNSNRPVRVGLFRVRETETLNDGTVRLITAGCAFDECGLVFSMGDPPVIGEDSYDHLIGGWWHWWRSW